MVTYVLNENCRWKDSTNDSLVDSNNYILKFINYGFYKLYYYEVFELEKFLFIVYDILLAFGNIMKKYDKLFTPVS